MLAMIARIKFYSTGYPDVVVVVSRLLSPITGSNASNEIKPFEPRAKCSRVACNSA